MKYGLTEKQINEIREIIASYPQVEQAILFGSRAIDTFKEASDVDIAILGEKCDFLLSAKIKDHLEEETYLPFFFDIIAYNTIKSPELKNHIQTKGKVIFQRKEEWKGVRLGDFAEINPSEKLSKGVNAKKIAMEAIQPFTKKVTNYSTESYKGGVKFRNGDTIMARITPSLENGKTSYIDILEDDEIGIGSTEFIVFREKGNISDKNFIYYLTISQVIRDTAIKSMTGSSGRQRVQTDVLRGLLFDAPPLPEQKAIAEVLSSLDDKIDLLHRQNKTLEEMAETLFRQWFIEERDEGWEEKPLREICTIRNGYAFKSETYIDNGVTIIRTKNFSEHFIELNGLVYISDQLAKEYSKYYLNRKEFLLVMVGASLGNYAIVTKDIIPALQNQNMWAFKAHNQDYQHFLNYILINLVKNNLHGASGSARGFFQKSVFYELKIVYPPLELIKKTHKCFEDILNKIELNREQLNQLVLQRDTLLPKLMSGEVTLKKYREQLI